jgi:prepilin-type N-terminal cleavage/methylation domain-containing protein
MRINKNLKAGFTLVEIMIVVAIIGLLAAIAIPNFVKARETAQKNACINNLRQIDGAIQQWALETKAAATDNVDSAQVATYLKNGEMPTCPLGNSAYTLSTVTEKPTCDNASAGHTL